MCLFVCVMLCAIHDRVPCKLWKVRTECGFSSNNINMLLENCYPFLSLIFFFFTLQNLRNEEQVAIIQASTVLSLAEKVQFLWCLSLKYMHYLRPILQ